MMVDQLAALLWAMTEMLPRRPRLTGERWDSAPAFEREAYRLIAERAIDYVQLDLIRHHLSGVNVQPR